MTHGHEHKAHGGHGHLDLAVLLAIIPGGRVLIAIFVLMLLAAF